MDNCKSSISYKLVIHISRTGQVHITNRWNSNRVVTVINSPPWTAGLQHRGNFIPSQYILLDRFIDDSVKKMPAFTFRIGRRTWTDCIWHGWAFTQMAFTICRSTFNRQDYRWTSRVQHVRLMVLQVLLPYLWKVPSLTGQVYRSAHVVTKTVPLMHFWCTLVPKWRTSGKSEFNFTGKTINELQEYTTCTINVPSSPSALLRESAKFDQTSVHKCTCRDQTIPLMHFCAHLFQSEELVVKVNSTFNRQDYWWTSRVYNMYYWWTSRVYNVYYWCSFKSFCLT
jgi:hypothetical protein